MATNSQKKHGLMVTKYPYTKYSKKERAPITLLINHRGSSLPQLKEKFHKVLENKTTLATIENTTSLKQLKFIK